MRRALVIAAMLASGCGEAAFSAHARDNDVGDLQRAMSASAQPPARAAHAMAFLVSDGKLVGFDLTDGKIAWQEKSDVRSRVIVGTGAIAHRQGDRELVVRASATGQVRATVTLPADESFVGATLDGDRLIYVVQTADKRSAVVALDGGGRQAWRRETTSAVGSPAARGGLVALPFAHQNLALVDGVSGREVARVRATDEEIAYARALPEGIYYGGARGIYRLDDKSVAGSRAGSSYAEAKLPGEQVRTAYHFDGYQPAQSAIGAFDRNRLLWRGRDAGAGFRDDLAVLHTYRFFFAFDARKGSLRWVYAHPRTDVVASEDAGSAIVFASADGDIGLIDPASGAVRVVQRTGLRVAGASFDADGIVAGAAAQPPNEEEVARTLEQIVWDHDARFGPVKVFAVDSLGAVPGLPVSRALLKIVRAAPGAGGPPPAAQQHAGEALVARKDRLAVPLMLEALAEHYDFLDDKQPRGVDVMARALAALEVKEAAPLLAAHLSDHETPERALKDIAQTLAHLGGPDAEHALREFLLEYHADPAFLLDPAPLNAAGEALVHAGDEARRAVAFVVDDKRTLQPVARQLRLALDEATQKEKAAQEQKEGGQAAPEKPE
ncbi:MAG: Basic proline-rich protein precursor [bacterium]|nr:Basic proline-rich protein precursor [bacterium]